MIDTHAHIYLEHFKEDLDQVVSRSREEGVTKILMPNIDSSTIEDMLHVEQKFPDHCISMMGLHPCSVKENYREELAIVEEWLSKRDFLAVGEIGTDLYWDKSFWKEQVIVFEAQCELALSYDLPIVIHCRESIDETIPLVEKYANQGLKGVFHCFTGTVDQSRKISELGFYIGLGGVSTFKKGGMEAVIPHMDRTKIVLETDSPYLTPTPHRGKRNEPAYTALILSKVAEYLDMNPGDLDNLTTENANNLFLIDQKSTP